MINKIEMKNCATYDGNGIELADCSKVNVIYGQNGSGKSTISNYFQDMNAPEYQNCSVIWEYGQQLERVHIKLLKIIKKNDIIEI